ncbi:MAG: class I SAM-dependent methyltransferase [Betaproteobacteria bacterium]
MIGNGGNGSHGRLIAAATAPYRAAGTLAWHFAQGKLRGDPVFAGLLEQELIPRCDRLLDLGCGQGLLASWLLAARARHAAGDWPERWPAPPRIGQIEGIELMPRDVARARTALGANASFAAGDIRRADFGQAGAIVILDVLHYLTVPEQDDILERARNALLPSGTLLLRIGDAGGGWGFRWSGWVDRAVMFARGHGRLTLHCRPLRDWVAALDRLGFGVQEMPMSRGTGFANVLLVARVPATPPLLLA